MSPSESGEGSKAQSSRQIGLASTTLCDTEKPQQHPWLHLSMLGVVPQMMLRTLTVGCRHEMRAIREPLVGVRDFVVQNVNNSMQKFVYRRESASGQLRERRSGRSRSRQSHQAVLAWNEGLHHEKTLDLKSAIDSLERAVELQPDNVEYLCRLSKQWSDSSFVPGTSHPRAKEANQKALDIAEKALKISPDFVLGHIAMCVSKGRLAVFSDNRTKIQLAREAEDSCKEALQLDPKNDLGHHLMGRWHYEMAGLNILARAFVRIVYGATLSPGSYRGALEEFKEAHRLAPHRPIHKVELGKACWKLGDREEAIRHLEDAMSLEVVDLNDYLEQEDGKVLLDRLKASGNRLPWQHSQQQQEGPVPA